MKSKTYAILDSSLYTSELYTNIAQMRGSDSGISHGGKPNV